MFFFYYSPPHSNVLECSGAQSYERCARDKWTGFSSRNTGYDRDIEITPRPAVSRIYALRNGPSKRSVRHFYDIKFSNNANEKREHYIRVSQYYAPIFHTQLNFSFWTLLMTTPLLMEMREWYKLN